MTFFPTLLYKQSASEIPRAELPRIGHYREYSTWLSALSWLIYLYLTGLGNFEKKETQQGGKQGGSKLRIQLSLIWNNISRVNQVDTEMSPCLTSLTPCVHIFILHIFPESISRENLTKHQSAFPVVIIL